MRILVPAIGVFLTAFCIWLTVRIVNRREKWAKRTAIALVLVLGIYPLSIGPFVALYHREMLPEPIKTIALFFYFPIFYLISLDGTQPIRTVIIWYGKLWMP
jgi:hypothetical protein